jgi:hypothetical protein
VTRAGGRGALSSARAGAADKPGAAGATPAGSPISGRGPGASGGAAQLASIPTITAKTRTRNMLLIVLEALVALVLLLLIVWWTMFSGREGGEPPSDDQPPS